MSLKVRIKGSSPFALTLNLREKKEAVISASFCIIYNPRAFLECLLCIVKMLEVINSRAGILIAARIGKIAPFFLKEYKG